MVDRLESCPILVVFHQLILLAFFFALRSCEYLRVGSSTTPADRRTLPLCTRSFVFWKNNRIVPHTLINLDCPDSVSIVFKFQKRDIRDEIISQSSTAHPKHCPVKVSRCIVNRMHTLINKQQATLDTPIFVFADSAGVVVELTSTAALKMLRHFLSSTDTVSYGIVVALVGLHSIRSSAAMAMYLANVPVFTMMLLGRWASLAFLNYIRKQVEEFNRNVSTKMIERPVFHQVTHMVNNASEISNNLATKNPSKASLDLFTVWKV